MQMTQTTENITKPARRMVQLRYVLTPIVIVFAAIFLLIVMGLLAPKPAKKPIQIKAPLVDVMSIEPSEVQFVISSQGSVVPRTETTMISEVSGMVTWVSDKFLVGGYFKKGEQLLHIDDITYKVAVLQAESRLETAQSNLATEKARAKQAEDEWKLTGKSLAEAPTLALRLPQLQKAKADLIAAKADLQEAQTKLVRTKIIAPYDAMLKEKMVDIGQYITVGASLAKTFAIDYAEVRLPVKQRDVPFLNLPRINQDNDGSSTVELFYEMDGQKHAWPSKVTRYEGVVDTSSRVHYVVAQVDDPYGIAQSDKEIRIGTFVNARINGKAMESISAIPREAVHGANTIYLVDDTNHLHMAKVNVLRADANNVYTTESIAANQRLVLTNLETPVEGMKLRINGEELSETNEQIAEQENNETQAEG